MGSKHGHLIVLTIVLSWLLAAAPPGLTDGFPDLGSGFVLSVSPAGTADRVFVGEYDHLFCLDAQKGKIVWSHKTPYATVDDGPILADGTLIYMGGGGHFTAYGLDPATGAQKWKRDHRASLVVPGGNRIYLNTQFGIGVLALDPRTGRKLWAYDEAYPGSMYLIFYDEQRVYTADYVLDAANGKVIERFPASVRAMATAGGKVFLANEDDELIAVAGNTGKQLWKVQASHGQEPVGVVASERYVVAAFYAGYPDTARAGVLKAYTPESGRLLWEKSFSSGDQGLLWDPIAGDQARVYLLLPGPGKKDTVLKALDAASGEELWTSPNPEGLMSPVAVTAKEIYANDDVGHIYVIDVNSGSLLRTLAYPSPPPAKY